MAGQDLLAIQIAPARALGALNGRWGGDCRLVALETAAIDVNRDPQGLRLTSLADAQCIPSGSILALQNQSGCRLTGPERPHKIDGVVFGCVGDAATFCRTCVTPHTWGLLPVKMDPCNDK